MSISKTEYILRSLSKISKKKWELFVVSRIIHIISDDEIEFNTQQLVRRPNDAIALTDLFFPQFSIHLEIDEPPHLKQSRADERREQDIVQITGHEVFRIKIGDCQGNERDINAIRSDVDEFIDRIRALKRNAILNRTFTPWDFERRYLAEPVIARGRVAVEDNVVFRTQVEAMRCFGFKGKGFQRGAWLIPDGSHDLVWFPRLYSHGIWENELVNEGRTIYERPMKNSDEASYRKAIESIAKQRRDGEKHPLRKYIVFAKARDPLGFNLLRFAGSFRMNFEESGDDVLRFDRISTSETIRSL